MLIVAAASGWSGSAGNKADVESSSRGIFDNRTRHPRGNCRTALWQNQYCGGEPNILPGPLLEQSTGRSLIMDGAWAWLGF